MSVSLDPLGRCTLILINAGQFFSYVYANRFHYFSEDGYDIDGPRPFEVRMLRLGIVRSFWKEIGPISRPIECELR